MKFVKAFILTIFSAVLFLLSVCLILGGLMALNQEFASMVIHFVAQSQLPAAYLIGGALLLLASLILYGMAGRREDPTATYTFEGEKGAINISLRALEDYITKRFSGRHIVNTIKTRIGTSRDRKKLRVHASITIWAEQNIRTAGETVQEEITRCLRDGLGLDNVEIVKVSVDKIITGKSSRSGSPPSVSGDIG